MVKRFFLAAVFCLAVFIIGANQAAAWDSVIKQVFPGNRVETREVINSPNEPGRVFIITIDYLGINDLKNGLPPNLNAVFSSGAVGLMNVNTAGAVNLENTYATIGTGAHVMVPPASPSVDVDSLTDGEMKALYRQWTGRFPPGRSLVYLDIEKFNLLNQKYKYEVNTGAMGNAVREKGYRSAAYGNSDSINGPRRPVITLAMNKEGYVDEGLVDKRVLKKDNHFPGGWITDYQRILNEVSKLTGDVKLITINLGDLARLKDAHEYMAQEQWQMWREAAMAGIDKFVGSLIGQIDKERDLLVLMSTVPGEEGTGEKDKMSVVVFYGNPVSKGLLTSPSTKRPGIIMNLDIAPSVLEFFGVEQEALLVGRPVRIIAGNNSVDNIILLYNGLLKTYEARPFLQKGYVVLQIILLFVSLYLIFFKKRYQEKIKPALLAVMSVPLTYLIMPLLPPGGILFNALVLLFLSAIITATVIIINNKFQLEPFLLICLITAFAISIDLLLGSPLQKASILGYDPIIGARFYGLGNEYMGVLIGSTLIGTASLVSSAGKFRKQAVFLSVIIYLLILGLIAAPQYGTNVGGFIAAASSFFVVTLLFYNIKLSWKRAAAVAAAVMLMLAALILYDAARPAWQQSHIGRTASLIASEGMDQVLHIINRKSEMNFKLVKYTIWSRVLLASLGILALLFYRPVGVMECIRKEHPYLFKGFIGVVAGSILAFIFNDSGVVAAATVMIFGAPPLVYLVLDRQKQ